MMKTNKLIMYSGYTYIISTNVYILGPSWPWSYGSWIYNYLCNHCLSPL